MAAYFEAAAVITTLVLLGQVLELRARSQTSTIRQTMMVAAGTKPASLIAAIKTAREKIQ